MDPLDFITFSEYLMKIENEVPFELLESMYRTVSTNLWNYGQMWTTLLIKLLGVFGAFCDDHDDVFSATIRGV